MSLEQALLENNELLKRHNELLEKVLNTGKPADSADKAEKAKPARRTRAAKEAPVEAEEAEDAEEVEVDEDEDDNDAPSLEKLTANIRSWIEEFGGEGTAEYTERRARWAAQLKKLNAKRLKDVDPKKLPDIAAWFEKIKAKGKLAADADEDDDV